jgi:broad specificity phosphatase PhoE
VEAKFILIRHGESLGNLKRIYLGHTDWDLSDSGKKQAQICAQYFKDADISAIYSSDLLRAYNTAVPHSLIHGLKIIPSEQLREVRVGAWEGKEISYISENWYKEFEIIWRGEFGTSTPPDGEAVIAAAKRFKAKLLAIAKEQSGTVLITAHAAVIRAFWCYISGIEPRLWGSFVPFPTNTSATFIGLDGENLVPIRYSFDDYLNKTEERADA